MNAITRRVIVTATLLVTLAMLVGCQTNSSTAPAPEQDPGMRRGAEAYRAYAQGDYVEAELSTNPTAIEGLPAGEVRHSMLLLYAFSLEGEGKADEAIETYRSLVRDAPLSFAADDARERLRILERTEADPDYAGWVAAARERAAKSVGNSSGRKPLERSPADFPPMVRAAGIEGYAVVEYGITPRGDTDAPVVVDSSPPLLFDGAAIRAVREWRYAKGSAREENERQAIRLIFQLDENETAAGASSERPESDESQAAQP